MNNHHCQWFHPNCCLTVKQLEYLSSQIAPVWYRLLIHLEVECYDIDALNEDGMRYRKDSKDTALQALIFWQRSNPKKAAFCKLKEALSEIKRLDIVQNFQKKYPLTRFCKDERRRSFNTKFFVGREDELKMFIEFCHSENKERLLVISGLPGLGKTSLVKKALDDKQDNDKQLQVLYPNFVPTFSEKDESSLENFAAALYEQLNPGEYISQNRMATLYNYLVDVICKPTVLIVDVSFVSLPERRISIFWKLVNKVLSNNSKLKIIVLCCKTPDYYNFKAKHIQLKEMLKDEAVALLKHENSSLTVDECQRLFKSCGGNPCILRKIAAHINNFKSPKEDLNNFMKELERNPEQERLQIFIQQSFLKNDLKIVFEELESNEKETLISLSNFPGLIPIFVIENIFGQRIKDTADHLWQNHSILERSDCGRFYQMSEITRSFVRVYCQEHSVYQKDLQNSKVVFIKYYLNILSELDDIFLSPETYKEKHMAFGMIEKYKSTCKNCLNTTTSNIGGSNSLNQCSCELIQILFILFQKIKSVFLICVNGGLNKTDKDLMFYTMDVCFKSFQFLRNILADEELQSMFETFYNRASELKDKSRIAFAISNLVFTKAYHKVKHEKHININYLSDVITFFENKNDWSDQKILLQLALCYINRGYLKGFYDTQFRTGTADLDKGRRLLSKLPLNGRVQIALYSVSGYLSALYYQSGRYGESIQEREKQVQGYRHALGIHPFTAKALHYQGQAYGKVKERISGINCCLVSYQMYRKLKGNGVDTMRVLSTIGKLLLKENRIKQGTRTLEKAIMDGRNALGEHTKVAWCYNQLIEAQTDLGADPEDIIELKKKRDKIQKEYESIFQMREKQTFVIQRSVENLDVSPLLRNEDLSMKLIIPFILLAVFFRFYFADTLNCYSF